MAANPRTDSFFVQRTLNGCTLAISCYRIQGDDLFTFMIKINNEVVNNYNTDTPFEDAIKSVRDWEKAFGEPETPEAVVIYFPAQSTI
jgi:hypothetical protein